MSITNSNCLIIGLPQSGKSTFLAALWHVVESNEIDSSIMVDSLPREREYLNKLRNAWESCKPLERNIGNFIQKIVLNISTRNNGPAGEFFVPDISGELFETQFESRHLTDEYVKMLAVSNGALLFINPDIVVRPVLISEAFNLPLSDTSQVEIVNEEKTSKPWNHKDAPTQVKLVDLLQITTLFLEKGLKIAVIISAWDLIKESSDPNFQKLSPSEWLEKELPLLSHYLISNPRYFSHRVYGVSAQGSKYSADNTKLLSISKSSKRIIVQRDDQVNNDITEPIKWLLNEE